MIKQISERFSPKQYLLEMAFALLALFGAYLIIAWASYAPLDDSWATSSAQAATINKAGAFGAWWVDLFFTLFGYVGHLFPFMLCGIPAYLILTKRAKTLTCTRFSLRMFGFVLLISGLCTLAAFLLSDTSYYLSGGVLGGSLHAALLPLLDKFGSLAIGFILAVTGFIFCSGKSLIQLVIRFYQWLTMQNIEKAPTEATSTEQEDNEFVEIDELEEAEAVAETDSDLVQAKDLINISGLNSQTENAALTSAAEQKSAAETDNVSSNTYWDNDNFSDLRFVSEEADPLPQVSIANQDPREISPADWQFSASAMPNEDSSAANFQQNFANDVSPISDEIPIVSLSAAQENIESTPPRDESQQAIAQPEFPSSKEEIKPTPTYKPYGDSLIHPAFQQSTTPKVKPTTLLPSLDLLERRSVQAQDITQDEILATSQRIEQQLRNFNIKAKVKDVLVGPVVTRYELELEAGIKASRVTSIDTDLARALMFRTIRVAEVIPGKPYIGIETPNDHRQMVPLRDVLDSDEFRNTKAALPMALGKDISGQPVVVDLATMPHLLVAGTTGSGKSVGVNTMILSLLYRVQPDQVKFIMIDPKVVELSIYNGIPHLLTPVVTDMKKAANALRWCVDEMERRYKLLSALRVRNIEGFNEKIDEYEALNMPIPNPLWKPGDTMDTLPPPLEKLSYIVVIVDEFADLMMVAGKQVEELISRLTQKARAIGIHLILATQRPSVDVMTGLIKANVPSRIAFTVSSKIDSRTILETAGAEALLGKGDMLYSPQGSSELVRVHGAFMSDDEVARVVDDWKARGTPDYIDGILDSVEEEEIIEKNTAASSELDGLFDEVVAFVQETGTVSISSIQRKYSIGFNRAARIVDQMEEQGIVSAPQSGKREVLTRY